MNRSWINLIIYMFYIRKKSCDGPRRPGNRKNIIGENKWKNLSRTIKISRWCRLSDFANLFVNFLELMKTIMLLIISNNGFLLISFLMISTSAVETDTIPNFAGNMQENVRSHHFGNNTASILNITSVTYAFTINGRKLFLPNIFPSSFIFYTDESSLNLINHEEILQRHFIFKIQRNSNCTGAKLRHNKKKQQPKSDEIPASEEDYFQEYDDVFAASSRKYTSNFTASTSCLTCQHHEKAKKDSLESIKKHILMRLQLSQPPNITVPLPIVPRKILDYFYKNFNYSKTMMPLYKQHYNYNINKRKRKVATTEDEMRVVEEQDEDIMISDNTHDYIDEDLLNPSMQGDEFYSRLHSIYVFPTSAFPHALTALKTKVHTFAPKNSSFPNLATSILGLEQKQHTKCNPKFRDTEGKIRLWLKLADELKAEESRLRYNRKPEIFNFKFNSDPSRISSTILHVYIKGQNWISECQPDLMETQNMEVLIKKKQEIMIIIYRALRRPNTMHFTHTVKLIQSRQKIPPGKGQWVEIEIRELSSYWTKTPNSTQSIVIRGVESWMRKFIVTEDQNSDKSFTMHIEIVTKFKNRYKRNAALDCRESDNEVRCCRYPLKVNFTNFGWNFIVAPQHFDAYFCNGECNVGYLEKYTHTHITSLSTSAKPCCSPQKLSPLALLYFDNNNKLMYSTIPNMSVEKCSCS